MSPKATLFGRNNKEPYTKMSVGMTQLPIIPQITKYVFLLCICIKTIMEPDTIMYTMWQQSKEYPLPSVTIKYALRNIPKLSIRW